MTKKKKPLWKQWWGIGKIILMISLLVFAIETGNKKWYFLGILLYSAFKLRKFYKNFIVMYYNAIKLAWNKQLYEGQSKYKGGGSSEGGEASEEPSKGFKKSKRDNSK